jgi:anti-sigma factor RsiW
MNETFEDELRRRLRPVNAPEGFADRVMRALPPDAKTSAKPAALVTLPSPRRPWLRRFGTPAALAASLLIAVLLGQRVAEQRAQLADLRDEQKGMEASRELMQALRLTSDKLDIAYQAVQSPPPASAEENRS